MTSASTSWPSRPGVGAGHRAAVVEIARDAAQGAVDEDPDRALGPAEDAGDLGGRHLVDEAQDQRPAAVGGQAPDGRQAAAASSRARRAALDVERCRRRARRPRAAPPDGGAGARRRSATALRAIWKSQTRNVEAPSPSAGRARSSNRPRFAQGGEERPLGGVLGLVMVAELVEGVAVHLGEVLPIEGVEPGRVAPGRLDERSVAVEMGDRRSRTLRCAPDGPSFQTPDEPSRYTRPAGGRAGRGGSRRRGPRRSPVVGRGIGRRSARRSPGRRRWRGRRLDAAPSEAGR